MNKFKIEVTLQGCGTCFTKTFEFKDWTKVQDKLREYVENLYGYTQNEFWPWIRELKLSCSE